MALDDILKDIDERKVANPPVRRNVYVADLNMNVNTDLETPDEINYATRTQVLNKPKQEYMGLKECENPFKSVFNASVESMKNVLDKVVPESIRKPAKEWATGAVATGVSLGNLSWGATKIFSSEFAMGSETLKQQRELEQSYMRREINQEEYSAKLKALLSKREQENSLMREDIAQEVKANNDEVNKWIADMGFGPNNDSKASKFFYNLGSANVSMLASLGAFALTKNPMLSIALLSTPEFTSGYLQAIEEGKSADQAMKSGAENFFWTAGTEYIGTKVLFSTLSKSSKLNEGAKRIFANSPRISMTAVAGAEEGTQEALQSVGTDLIYKFNDISDLKAIDIIKNASNDFLFAFLSGGMVGAVTSNIQYNDILNKTKKELTALKDDKGQKVYTPEQADRVARQTAQLAMSQNIIDEVTGVSRAERDNSLSKEARNPKTIKQELEDNLKKMEVALPEIKKELMDIKTKVKDNVSGLGLDNEQAEMVAEMTQARAMMYYNAFGITPLQFYYLNELEIRVDENSNILSNGRETGYTVRFNEEKVSQAISSGNISNIIQNIRTKENLDKFGDFVNKLVNEGRLTQEQRSMIYSQLADRMNEIPTVAQVVDRVREEEVDKFNQPAYHGTPHRFEEFSTEKIGTGEGAQAHGWGLYFAKDRDVSESYREVLVDDPYIERHTYKGKPIKEYYDITGKEIKDLVWQDIMRGSYGISNLVNKIKEEKQKYKKELEQNKKRLKELQEDKENDWKELINHYKENSSQIEKKLDYINSIDLKEIDSHLVGQVFQVEIPEDDVLLDEQKSFQAQPKKVQEAIEEIMKDDEDGKLYNDLLDTNTYDEEEYVDRSLYLGALDGIFKEGDIGNTGKEIYKGLVVAIQDKYGITEDKAQKESSLILNKYGIKGISYDGEQDGRAYVIFDDKAVKVLEKFYQGEKNTYNDINDFVKDTYTDLTEREDGPKKSKNLDKLQSVEIKNVNKSFKTAKELKTFLNEILNNISEITVSETGQKISISKNKIGKSLKRIRDNRNNQVYKEIKSLIENSKYLGFEKADSEHPNVKGQDLFLAKMKIGNKEYLVEFRADVPLVEKKLYYAGHKVQASVSDWVITPLLKQKPTNNIIQNNENVNINYNDTLENIEKQVKSIKEDIVRQRLENQVVNPVNEDSYTTTLPKNWKDKENFKLVKGNIYKINNSFYGIYVGEKDGKLGFISRFGLENFVDYISPKNVIVDVSANYPQTNNNRGEVMPRPVDTPVTEQTKSIITVFSGGDRSTIIHEMAHIFLRDIEIIENQGGVQDEQFKKIKKTLDNWLGKKKGQKYTVEQQEKFAQGFETYMATGQAPKEELKSVFDYFKNWMSQIYNGIKNMIPITPEVKNMFDEILTLQPTNNAIQTQTEGGNGGGGNIVNTPQTQEGGDIVPVTPDAKDLGKVERKKNTSIIDFTNKFIQPVSTRLGAIDVRLEYEMKMFEARLAMRQTKYKNASLDFLKETDDLQKKNKQDYLNFDRALKNRDINTINRITEKYPKLKTAYEKVRTMLDDIKADLMIYGVGSLENYFPRKIANIDGLISYLEGTENWSEIERAMKQSDKNYKSWSEEKKAEFVASYLQGYRAGVKTSSAHTKQRKIDTINDEMDRYYENSNNALLEYINTISNFIETAKMLKLGKDKVFEMGGITKDGIIDMKQVVNNIESVLGTYVKDLVNNKTITREQEREIAQILKARFNFQNTNNLVSVIKSIGYLTTLGNINSVITQFGDLTYSINNAGVFGTLKAIFGDKKIKMQDIGIDHPAEDFADGIGFTQKLLNAVLTSIGFKYVDSLGKNTYIATTFMKYKKMVEKDEKKAFDDISRRYGEEFAKDLIDDIKNNRLSENVYLFAHSELSRVQPISLSEVPTEYLTHPVGRVFYSLKTFWIKQFNRVITDNKRLIQEGIKEKNADKVKEGATSMARLIILFVILGAGTDMLKDLIYLRKIDLEDTILDNFLKILGISRYTMYKGREEGYGRVFLDTIFTVPVVQMFDSFLTELGRAGKGKMKLKDLRIASNIPIIGNPYYWWLGGGRTKEKKKNKRRVL